MAGAYTWGFKGSNECAPPSSRIVDPAACESAAAAAGKTYDGVVVALAFPRGCAWYNSGGGSYVRLNTAIGAGDASCMLLCALPAPGTSTPAPTPTLAPSNPGDTSAPVTQAPTPTAAVTGGGISIPAVVVGVFGCLLAIVAAVILYKTCRVLEVKRGSRNRKGLGLRWDFFISHVQSETKDIAADLYHTLRQRHGLSSWLDVKMPDRSVLAMEEGVRLSDKVLVIVSLSYFSRPFCVKELRWALQYGKEVVVAIPVELKSRIGEILKDCPDDLRSIGDIDFKTVDRSDVEHFELSVRQLIQPRVGRRIAPPPVPVPTLLIEDESTQATINNVQLKQLQPH
jgi:hypothetical protein